MIRVLVAVVVGGFIAFVWSFTVVMLMPWRSACLDNLPNEENVTKALRESDARSGVYLIPGLPKNYATMTTAEMAAWEKRFQTGPSGILYLAQDGIASMSPWLLVHGFGINLLSAAVATAALAAAAPSLRLYLLRVLFVAQLGAFAGLTTHLNLWYLGFAPLGVALANTADLVLGWAAAGLVMAWLLRPVTAAASK
jgi:hypothetical protein